MSYMHGCQHIVFHTLLTPHYYLQALLGMFSESQSFYFCLDSDLTQSLQRQIESPEEEKQLPLWEQVSHCEEGFRVQITGGSNPWGSNFIPRFDLYPPLVPQALLAL